MSSQHQKAALTTPCGRRGMFSTTGNMVKSVLNPCPLWRWRWRWRNSDHSFSTTFTPKQSSHVGGWDKPETGWYNQTWRLRPNNRMLRSGAIETSPCTCSWHTNQCLDHVPAMHPPANRRLEHALKPPIHCTSSTALLYITPSILK